MAKIFAILFCMLLCSPVLAKEIPEIKNGYLDLSRWDFDNDGVIKLDGQWEFYWKKLLTHEDFSKEKLPELTGYIEVPGYWNNVPINGKKIPSLGFATYRLRIKTDSPKKILALKIPDQSSAYMFFVNGELVSSSGVVSDRPDKMVAEFKPLVRTFDKTSDELEIIIQVANNFHNKGGIWLSIDLGSQEQIIAEQSRNTFYDVMLMGVVFILFIYHVWIYLLRRSEIAAFWFGILCLGILLRALASGDRFIELVFPFITTREILLIEYLNLVIAPTAFLIMLRYLFLLDFSNNVLRILLVVSAIEVSVIVLTKPIFYSSILWIFQSTLLIKCAYALYLSALCAYRKRPFAVAIFSSTFFLTACVFNDVLYTQLIIQSILLTPTGFFIFVIAQAYILASRISSAFSTIENLSLNLEKKVEERTNQLQVEKKKSDDLLLNILPAEIADELKESGKSNARLYENVSVIFTDFVNFTGISENLGPEELVTEIDLCFREFDVICERNGLEKIKTIGDAFMAVCGLPNLDEDHAYKVVSSAKEILLFMEQRKNSGGLFDIRIGINCGPVVAGIVGSKKFAYDIWGDTVNVASRMESNSEPGRINISGSCHQLIKNHYNCIHRGKITAKNKGEVDMYFVGEAVEAMV